MVMQHLLEHTGIPVPHVRGWAFTKESPHQLGPFIIMDLIEGELLGSVLKQPNEDPTEPVVLDPNVDEAKLDFVHDQIAGFMLELSRLEFPRIGAISKDATSGRWAITGPPLTYDMNEVVTLGDYPTDQFASRMPFNRASDYFTWRSQCFQKHVEAQRNIASDDEDLVWNKFVARRCFAELIPVHCVDDDARPFPLFCDDLRPSNMLVDPETMRITAVLDFEFTNVMPSQFTYDVPWWLLLKQPTYWVSDQDGGELKEFLELFEPRKEQFLRAMERAEARSPPPAGKPLPSVRMRESWNSGRFWFNLASRCSFDIGEIYWDTLHKTGMGETMLTEATLAEKERFVKKKMAQFAEYYTERMNDKRFEE